MSLAAYAQAAEPGLIRLWVGLFDTEQPPPLAFRIDGQPATPLGAPALTPIRDRTTGPGGLPANHRGVFSFVVPQPGRPYRVEVQAGAWRHELVTPALPHAVPQVLDGSFNILLCSCYFQPEDASGLLGTIVSQIQRSPQLTLMLGDQVYLDLPLFEDLPETEPALSQRLGEKYRRNWASSALGIAGLGPVLARAPVACLPDDHEFWNNYPFEQKQLPNTWRGAVRRRWADAALALYDDYQRTGVHGAQRIDVEPLKLLLIDTRCRRDDRFERLMSEETMAAVEQWAADLLAARAAGQPVVGLLASGQALFIDAPQRESDKRNVDAELANYEQFHPLYRAIERLADAGVPVLYITGDVHWGRVASGTDLRSGRTLLHEVICSPSRLIRVPFADAARESWAGVRGIFGKPPPWPRHTEPEDVPERFGDNRRFGLRNLFKQRGDQVAVLSFSRAGNGVDFQATYYAVHPDKAIAKSQSTERIPLRSS